MIYGIKIFKNYYDLFIKFLKKIEIILNKYKNLNFAFNSTLNLNALIKKLILMMILL